MEKILIANLYQLFQLFSWLISKARSWAGVNILFKRNSGVISAIELKQIVIDAGIFGIFVGKFRYWQQFCSIILLPIDKHSEVCFYHAILSLSLTICLRLEGYR